MQRKKNFRAPKLNLNKLIYLYSQIQSAPTEKNLYLLIIIKSQFVIESDANIYEIYILRFKKGISRGLKKIYIFLKVYSAINFMSFSL